VVVYRIAMKLKKWLEKKEITNQAFAGKIGVHSSYITLLTQNQRRPSPQVAKAIEDFTKGEVTIMELLFPGKK